MCQFYTICLKYYDWFELRDGGRERKKRALGVIISGTEVCNGILLFLSVMDNSVGELVRRRVI